MKERDLGAPAMRGGRSGIRKHFPIEVKPELSVEGRKGVNQREAGTTMGKSTEQWGSASRELPCLDRERARRVGQQRRED